MFGDIGKFSSVPWALQLSIETSAFRFVFLEMYIWNFHSQSKNYFKNHPGFFIGYVLGSQRWARFFLKSLRLNCSSGKKQFNLLRSDHVRTWKHSNSIFCFLAALNLFKSNCLSRGHEIEEVIFVIKNFFRFMLRNFALEIWHGKSNGGFIDITRLSKRAKAAKNLSFHRIL